MAAFFEQRQMNEVHDDVVGRKLRVRENWVSNDPSIGGKQLVPMGVEGAHDERLAVVVQRVIANCGDQNFHGARI